MKWPSKYTTSSVIVGEKSAFLNYNERYDEMMLKHRVADISMGEDRYIIGSLTYEHPDLVIPVTLSD